MEPQNMPIAQNQTEKRKIQIKLFQTTQMKYNGFLNPTKDQSPIETTGQLETHYSGTTRT
jgi:hypothetical protein